MVQTAYLQLRPHGLGSLSAKPVPRGGRFSLGVELDGLSVVGTLTYRIPIVIQAAIQKSGYVQNVTVTHLSGTFNPFISIEGRSAYEHGSADDLKDTLLGIITTQGYRYDPASVKYTAETFTPAYAVMAAEVTAARCTPINATHTTTSDVITAAASQKTKRIFWIR